MRSQEFVSEIERLPARYYQGGKDKLKYSDKARKLLPLPGGSGLLYSIQDRGNADFSEVKIYDANKNIIGELSLLPERAFPVPGALAVKTITVDEDRRGQGIAKALYGIVLTIMRRTLVSGDSQTPGGRRNWVSLASIPGVDVRGWVAIDEGDFHANPEFHDQRLIKQLEANIDTVMGKLGGQYIGRGRRDEEFFAFAVQPNATGKELEALVKTNLSRVYDESYAIRTGLYAQWSGQ